MAIYAVAYLRSEDEKGQGELSFMLACSCVSQKQQLSVPRLELCAALTGARRCVLLSTGLTLPIRHTTLWTGSSTVLHWLQSDSCRLKVFVGVRVPEIQTLTNSQDWRFVDSTNDPADGFTRDKSLPDLLIPNRWTNGPPFLYGPPQNWPKLQPADPECDETLVKHKKINHFKTYQELLDSTAQFLSNLTRKYLCCWLPKIPKKDKKKKRNT